MAEISEAAQFNGEVSNIESNINKVDSFDENISDEAAKIRYPSIKCLSDVVNSIWEKIYPVGSFFECSENIDPSQLFGGTWVRIKGKFLLAADDDIYQAGTTGGEEKHTLTVEEMPSHKHLPPDGTNNTTAYTWREGTTQDGFITNTGDTRAIFTEISGYAGGDQPHNNMPPYLSVYVWKRIA